MREGISIKYVESQPLQGPNLQQNMAEREGFWPPEGDFSPLPPLFGASFPRFSDSSTPLLTFLPLWNPFPPHLGSDLGPPWAAAVPRDVLHSGGGSPHHDGGGEALHRRGPFHRDTHGLQAIPGAAPPVPKVSIPMGSPPPVCFHSCLHLGFQAPVLSGHPCNWARLASSHGLAQLDVKASKAKPLNPFASQRGGPLLATCSLRRDLSQLALVHCKGGFQLASLRFQTLTVHCLRGELLAQFPCIKGLLVTNRGFVQMLCTNWGSLYSTCLF